MADALTLRRLIGAAALVAAVGCAAVVGVLGYHAVAANRVSDAPTTAAVRSAFAEAERSWRSHIDLPVHRLALTSAEEYGSGTYLFVFDAYFWYGIGSGYATHGEGGCGGGGLMRNGGFAGIGENTASDADSVLAEARAQCARAHGPGRVVAPAP